MSFTEKVWAACAKIPKGRVSTYGAIAKAIGKPHAARAVGNALNKNRSKKVPCHRVVKSDGKVGGFQANRKVCWCRKAKLCEHAFGTKKKIVMLRKEGLRIEKGRIAGFKTILFS